MDSETVARKAYAAVGAAAFGDRIDAIALVEEIGVATDTDTMFGVCCGFGEAVKRILASVYGPQMPGSMTQLVMPEGAERSEPEKTFAARFLTAYMNDDRATCMALFNATFSAPGRYGHAENVVALLDMTGSLIRNADKVKRAGLN